MPAIARLGTAVCLALAAVTAFAQEPARWVDADGRPTPRALEAVNVLAGAAADGLDPADYGAEPLASLAGELRQEGARADTALRFDTALEEAFARYLRELRMGRVDARRLGFRLPARSTEAADAHQPAAADPLPPAALSEALAPPFAQYRQLREWLARYRVLAGDATLASPPLAATVRPGDALPRAAALARFLRSVGDVPADAITQDDRYDELLVAGVRRFQARHGLADDGVIGLATRQALAVPLAQRVRQIEFAMERLRWLQPGPRGRFLAINIPNFRLWAWDPADPTGTPPLTMGVIVGRALDTRTPVLQEEMRSVIFRPYWNVPRSILRKELLPKIRRDPGVLEREQLEIVRGDTDAATPVAASPANLALLEQGVLRLRQRPGPRNSLGLVKFVFPNDDNIYLHGTPARQLFQRPRRDFSHGCVRLEDPVALAQWVLREQPQWTRERIEAAMADGQPARVMLREPMPVLLFYTTAFVAPGGTGLHFADDIYGHDRRLEQALRQR